MDMISSTSPSEIVAWHDSTKNLHILWIVDTVMRTEEHGVTLKEWLKSQFSNLTILSDTKMHTLFPKPKANTKNSQTHSSSAQSTSNHGFIRIVNSQQLLNSIHYGRSKKLLLDRVSIIIDSKIKLIKKNVNPMHDRRPIWTQHNVVYLIRQLALSNNQSHLDITHLSSNPNPKPPPFVQWVVLDKHMQSKISKIRDAIEMIELKMAIYDESNQYASINWQFRQWKLALVTACHLFGKQALFIELNSIKIKLEQDLSCLKHLVIQPNQNNTKNSRMDKGVLFPVLEKHVQTETQFLSHVERVLSHVTSEMPIRTRFMNDIINILVKYAKAVPWKNYIVVKSPMEARILHQTMQKEMQQDGRDSIWMIKLDPSCVMHERMMKEKETIPSDQQGDGHSTTTGMKEINYNKLIIIQVMSSPINLTCGLIILTFYDHTTWAQFGNVLNVRRYGFSSLPIRNPCDHSEEEKDQGDECDHLLNKSAIRGFVFIASGKYSFGSKWLNISHGVSYLTQDYPVLHSNQLVQTSYGTPTAMGQPIQKSIARFNLAITKQVLSEYLLSLSLNSHHYHRFKLDIKTERIKSDGKDKYRTEVRLPITSLVQYIKAIDDHDSFLASRTNAFHLTCSILQDNTAIGSNLRSTMSTSAHPSIRSKASHNLSNLIVQMKHSPLISQPWTTRTQSLDNQFSELSIEEPLEYSSQEEFEAHVLSIEITSQGHDRSNVNGLLVLFPVRFNESSYEANPKWNQAHRMSNIMNNRMDENLFFPFVLRHRDGTICSIKLNELAHPKPLILTSTQMNSLKKWHKWLFRLFTFNQYFEDQEIFTGKTYLIVPSLKSQLSNHGERLPEIDWSFVHFQGQKLDPSRIDLAQYLDSCYGHYLMPISASINVKPYILHGVDWTLVKDGIEVENVEPYKSSLKESGIELKYKLQPLLIAKQIQTRVLCKPVEPSWMANEAMQSLASSHQDNPLEKNKKQSNRKLFHQFLIPELYSIMEVDQLFFKDVLLIPCILYEMESYLRIHHVLRHIIQVPISTEMALSCMSLASSAEINNLENLEVLGDTILKLTVSAHVFAKSQHKNATFISLKQQIKYWISNQAIYEAIKPFKLENWIRSSAWSPRQWTPPGFSPKKDNTVMSSPSKEDHLIELKTTIRGKGLADVAEALLGACYLSGGWELVRYYLKLIGFGEITELCHITLHDTQVENKHEMTTGIEIDSNQFKVSFNQDEMTMNESERKSSLATNVLPTFAAINYNYPTKDRPPTEIELALGYTWRNPLLLEQALSHETCPTTTTYSSCLLPLTLVGDAVIDFVLIKNLIWPQQQYLKPGTISDLKAIYANGSTLAYLAYSIGLHRHLKFNCTPLKQHIECYIAFCQETVDRDKESERNFGAFSAIDYPTPLNDVMESIIGSIFIDSNYSLQPITDRIVHWFSKMEKLWDHTNRINSKRMFHELVQKTGGKTLDISKKVNLFVERFIPSLGVMHIQLNFQQYQVDALALNKKQAMNHAAYKLVKCIEQDGGNLKASTNHNVLDRKMNQETECGERNSGDQEIKSDGAEK